MSIKRMVTKLALAFAAKKGMEAFQNMGGLAGLQAALQGKQSIGAVTEHSGRDSINRRPSDSGGLGNLLGSLGHAGATNGREGGLAGQISPINNSLPCGGSLTSMTGALTAGIPTLAGMSAAFDFRSFSWRNSAN